MRVRIVVLTLVLPLSSCIPHRIQQTPDIAGQVIDGATRQPIAGATLQFERYQDKPVVTSAGGRFDIPANYPITRDPFPFRPPVCFLHVNALGYQSVRLRYSGWHKYLNESIALERR